MHRWVVTGAHRFSLPNAQKAQEHLAGNLIHDSSVKSWLSRFLPRWLKQEPEMLQKGG
jgi:GMP synthase (glutamine-hydrolysing)